MKTSLRHRSVDDGRDRRHIERRRCGPDDRRSPPSEPDARARADSHVVGMVAMFLGTVPQGEWSRSSLPPHFLALKAFVNRPDAHADRRVLF